MRQILLLLPILLVGCGEVDFKKVQFIRDVQREVVAECPSTGMTFTEGYDLDHNGTLEGDEISNYNYICDGTNGLNGVDGIVDLVDPCGDGPGQDEVLIITTSGSVVAWYSGLGLSVLNENQTYVTTDAQSCVFQVVNSQVVEL